MMNGLHATPTYNGECFCGAVQFAVTGEPYAMGYCHCNACRKWSAAPVTAFALWQDQVVTILSGAAQVGSYKWSEKSTKTFCQKCGGAVMAETKGDRPYIDVYPPLLPSLLFTPQMHIFSESAVLDINDALPRFKDLPAEAGGSGAML